MCPFLVFLKLLANEFEHNLYVFFSMYVPQHAKQHAKVIYQRQLTSLQSNAVAFATLGPPNYGEFSAC